ncbi:GerAB/ArcD/ProY family transporter [Paenibacillus radicis (ex Gao et al. 2016)]|uniref:Germination protein n=1 Tax=Paenibacillus radicis (ex Gao et al. 2016) TaxID=1737354 RepID=A0A917GY53_9BACL|nr:endospore germination permease [Paenibacillus radicis (ex Gao et al. 2016)]GGG61079.1 germination protein [Paenibacillus radicis (ex Gao et al. 2016)]
MTTNPMINVRTFTILVIFFMIGTSILITPAGLANEAKQDAWIAAIAGVIIDCMLALLYVMLGERFGHKTLIELCLAAFGKWAGALLALCYIVFFFILASLMIGDLGFFLTTQIMPETPIEILQILFVAVVVAVIRAGLVVYSRAAEIFFPLLVFMFSLLIMSMLHIIDFRNFQPALEFGLKPVLKGGFSFYGLQEIIVLLMLYPYVKRSGSRKNAFVGGVMVGGIFLIITTACCIGVMSSLVTSNQLYPAYVLAKKISIGHFLERIEGVMMFIWIISIVIKVIITFDAAVLGLAQVCKLKESKPLVIPVGFGMIVMALLCYPNTIFIQDFLSKNWSPFSTIFMIFVPLLLLLTLSVRKGMGGKM